VDGGEGKEAVKREGEQDEEEALPSDKLHKKSKNDSFELVEYSPDELRSVDKEMLNAEITQLEGRSELFRRT